MRSWFNGNRPRALALLAIGVVVIGAVVSRLPVLGLGEIDWDEGVYWLSMQSMRNGHALYTSVYSSQTARLPVVCRAAVGAARRRHRPRARAVMPAWGAVAVAAGSVIGWRLGGRVAAVGGGGDVGG